MPAPGGIVKWTPAVNDSYKYLGPGPENPNSIPTMNCKEHNASGLLDGESDAGTRLNAAPLHVQLPDQCRFNPAV